MTERTPKGCAPRGDIRLYPHALGGEATAIPSKSHAQRLIFCAALAKGASHLTNIGHSGDVQAAIDAVRALGLADARRDEGDVLTVCDDPLPAAPYVPCGESAAVLRLALPLAMRGKPVEFRGEGRLMDRPMEPYLDLVRGQGGAWEQSRESIAVRHSLRAGTLALPGGISSQFFSGLMLALPLLPEDSVLRATTPIESMPYLHLTAQTQRLFGVDVRVEDDGVTIPGGQQYVPASARAEGDWSYASILLVMGALGKGIRLRGLSAESMQADRAVTGVMQSAGCGLLLRDGRAEAPPSAVRPFRANVAQCPDLAPALVALACGARGTSAIEGAARLRHKESDRLASLSRGFRALGGQVEERPDALIVHGAGRLRGGDADCAGDHRVAMALAAASGICDGPVVLRGAHCVAKSAPDFWGEFLRLGGRMEAI